MNDKLWDSLDRAVAWMKYAESKALAILAIHAVTLGFFLSLCSENAETVKGNAVLIVALIIALLLTLISLFFCFKCLNPRLKLSGGISPLYFGSIAHSFKNSSEYAKFFKESLDTEAKITHEVAGQVFVNSQIAWRKFKDVSWGMRFMVLSILFWVAVATILLFN